MARIAELFGVKVSSMEHPNRVQHPDPKEPTSADGVPEEWTRRHCPFTDRTCDVTANRSDRAFLDLSTRGINQADRTALSARYESTPIPLGICSLMTQRQNETTAKPWIVCPKRLLELRGPKINISPEVRKYLPIEPGTKVRCWWEVKFRSKDEESTNFFEYTFDYLLMPYDKKPMGPPYVVEIMTSSTRGGGLTEHMVDTLLLRDQRKLRGVVDSPYTPNYRQVFERMLGQLFAKSEIAEAWGGRTVWLVQDVLLDYIAHTTDFKPQDYKEDEGNVYMMVYSLVEKERGYDLLFDRILRGFSRPRGGKPDFTKMLGLGYAPKLDRLLETLARGEKTGSKNWVDFVW